MGFKHLHNPYSLEKGSRACACGKGVVKEWFLVEEESDYPPFERGPTYYTTTCPDNCENIQP